MTGTRVAKVLAGRIRRARREAAAGGWPGERYPTAAAREDEALAIAHALGLRDEVAYWLRTEGAG